MTLVPERKSSSTQPPPMKVTILRWRAVAHWRWGEVSDDDCGICRNSFDACCPDCKVPGDDCPPVSGECNHSFHIHCIVRWLDAQQQGGKQQCPMCRADWAFRAASNPESAAAAAVDRHRQAQAEAQEQQRAAAGELVDESY